ncbi:MAG: hypothetical protein KI790_12230 [Cyclobacteriaceae bacterium]|nr:hypothetical protein [Cyclobacteriaceae bacterium HetDA_MAG_MS6]
MKKTLAFIALLLLLFSAFSQARIQATHLRKDKIVIIKPNKIQGVILHDGQVLQKRIKLDMSGFITKEGIIPMSSARVLELRKVKAGHAFAFPFQAVGIGSMALGGLMAASDLTDDEDDVGMLIGGTVLMGTGFGLFKVGQAIRPLQGESITTMTSSEWKFEIIR